MPFDLTPLTNDHILLFGIGFILVYGIVAFLISRPQPLLRIVGRTVGSKQPQLNETNIATSRQRTYYAGPVLVSSIALAAFLAIDDIKLSLGLLAAAIFTLIVGILDEQHPLSPGLQLVWQSIIVIIAISWGWTIQYVTNPFGPGVIDLQAINLGNLLLPGGLLTIIWLLTLMNAINWLDGTDGLATGVSFVALITIALVSLLPSVQDSQTLLLALLGAGATLGFLLWNFPPAKIYLGTTGSWFLGLYVGLVAIVGGGKIVTTLLVLAIPVFDLAAVTIQRIGTRQVPWQGDTTRHLHHRLRARGFKPGTIAIAGMVTSTVLGIVAITVQTQQKLIALLVAAVILAVLTASLVRQQAKRPTITQPNTPVNSRVKNY